VSRLIRFASTAIAALALASTLVACGGSELSADDFRAEADEICVNQVKGFIEIEQRLGVSEGLAEEAVLQGQLGKIRERSLSELEELEAPDEVAQPWDRYLQIRRQLIDLRQEHLKLLREGKEKGLGPLNEKISSLNGDLDEVGEEAGLTACASVLPQDQAEEALAVVKEVALTSDPKRVCDELVTESYLEVGFEGKFETCASFQKENGDNFADKIEVEKIEGVADTQALVTITEIGGALGGEETIWALHREDGKWKVNLVSSVS
jgi:hypothetical protein